jgi:hypothetical protein
MKEGVQDFRSGQRFDHTVFFGENVDIHHIFPQDWCKNQWIKPNVFDSIINKTPLSYRTNRIIGGVAPSEYIAKLETGNATTPPIDGATLDGYLTSHLINSSLLLRGGVSMRSRSCSKNSSWVAHRIVSGASFTKYVPGPFQA